MVHVGFFVIFAVIAAVALFRPWIGVVAAYGTVVLQPQGIWWWDFTGIRPDLWVLVPTAIGMSIAILRGEIDLTTLRSKRNLYILILWICAVVSFFFGPYVNVVNQWRVFDSGVIFTLINKMFLLYFMAALCVDSERKLMALFYVICGSAAYLVYWANAQYFVYHVYGRLEGPRSLRGAGIYGDQNNFAMAFVVAQSFFWYLGLSRKNPILRWASWLIIPFSWNAVFMTGSRGGLVGLGVTLFLIAIRSRYKLFKYALIPAFVVVFLWQGGFMKSRAETIQHYSVDQSAQDRLEAWRTALRVIKRHPLTGVGPESFIVAFQDFSFDKPREAHDTPLQITAESGVLGGLMYVLIVVSLFTSLWQISTEHGALEKGPELSPVYLVNEVALIAFAGLVTCSLFLSLQNFEIFYCLNVMANGVVYIERKRLSRPSEMRLEPLTSGRSAVLGR